MARHTSSLLPKIDGDFKYEMLRLNDKEEAFEIIRDTFTKYEPISLTAGM